MNTCILIGITAWLHLTDGSGTSVYVNVDNIAHVYWSGWIGTNGTNGAMIRAWSESEDRYLIGEDIMDMIKDCE